MTRVSYCPFWLLLSLLVAHSACGENRFEIVTDSSGRALRVDRETGEVVPVDLLAAFPVASAGLDDSYRMLEPSRTESESVERIGAIVDYIDGKNWVALSMDARLPILVDEAQRYVEQNRSALLRRELVRHIDEALYHAGEIVHGLEQLSGRLDDFAQQREASPAELAKAQARLAPLYEKLCANRNDALIGLDPVALLRMLRDESPRDSTTGPPAPAPPSPELAAD